MSQAIKNVLNSFAFDKVTELMKTDYVTPEILDVWEAELHKEFKSREYRIGRGTVRELLVQYILSEFDLYAFGIESPVFRAGEISDKTIRRMKNQRKKGFVDLKIVKNAR